MLVRCFVYVISSGELRMMRVYPGENIDRIPGALLGVGAEKFSVGEVSKYPMDIFMSKEGISYIPFLDKSTVVRKRDGYHVEFTGEKSEIPLFYRNKWGTTKVTESRFILSTGHGLNDKSTPRQYFSHFCEKCGARNSTVEKSEDHWLCWKCIRKKRVQTDSGVKSIR
jgi:hypothetical protein